MPRLITLGSLSVRNGTDVNGLANPRSRLAILAVLAVAGDRGMRREKLAAMFWPESDDEKARNALRQALFTLRRDLGSGDITLGTADLRLNPDVLTADVTEFYAALRADRFEDAAALYEGPFLDGVFVRESPEFERWADEQRSRLSADYGRALEKAAAVAAARGDLRQAATWWQRRAIHDPLSGRVARLFMEALAVAGDREQAIRHAAIYAQLVRQELEAEPDPEVLRAADRLREAISPPAAIERASADALPLHSATTTAGLSAAIGTRADRRPWYTAIRSKTGALVLVGGAGFVTASLVIALKGPPVQSGLVGIGRFENRSADTAMYSLGDHAASGIVQLLSQAPHVAVIDFRPMVPESASKNGAARELVALARRSAAEYLVRGYVDRRADVVVASAQVVEARTGAILFQLEPIAVSWGHRDVVIEELRERIAGAIVALSDTTFPLWRERNSRPPRYSAYHEFSQGLDALVNQGEISAITHFRRAMEVDPEFAQAKLWYLEQAMPDAGEKGRMDSVRAVLERQRPNLPAYDKVAIDRQLAFIDGRLEDVYTAARQLVVLAPQAPDARTLLAQAAIGTRRYHEAIDVLHSIRASPTWLGGHRQRLNWDLLAHRLVGDHDAGIAEWRRAVAEAPDDWSICVHGFRSLAVAGREESVDSLLTACDRLPDAHPVNDNLLQIVGRHYRIGGHRDAAERAFRRALVLRRERATTAGRPMPAVADLHIDLGEWREAFDILRSVAGSGDGVRGALAVAAAHVGDTATALTALHWFKSRSRRAGADMNRAFIQLALGQRDSAIASLRAAIAAGVAPAWMAWNVRPELEPLRGDPRFEALVRPVR